MQKKTQNKLFLANPPDENYRYFELGDQEEYSMEWPLAVELRMIEIVRSIKSINRRRRRWKIKLK